MDEREDVKKVLKSYQPALKYAIKCMEEWDAAEAVSIRSPKMDGMPRTGSTHGLELQVALIERYRKRAEKERERCMAILERVEGMVESLEDADQRNILKKRYIEGMEWSQVATYTNMAERTVFYIHGKALNELRRKAKWDI